jgi:replicative superfamily II helicase
MVDFTKRLKKKALEKKKNPIEIYNSLDRRSETGPLRPSQEAILIDWYENKLDNTDNIVKLHTGEGKTLIGLLMLQSKLNETEEPCLYLCPNVYLANQVKAEAKKFGIATCDIDDDNDLPESFLSGKSILVAHVQKLFNGRTIFRLNNKSIKVGSVILDDSHACIDAIRNSLTIKIKKDHPAFKSIVGLFQEELSEQGEGSFLEIISGEYSTKLPVSYWSWHEKRDELARILLDNKDRNEIKFAWDVIKDEIANCQCFVSGSYLEISPILVPIESFGSFAKAKHRILMSATTQDDAFAIKGLGISVEAIKAPLSHSALRWSGEKMILIPSLIDDSLDRETVINWLASPVENRGYGVAVLTPDFKKNAQYEKIGAEVADSKTIFEYVQKLKSGNSDEAIVFANRYDGIDLPDDACRILIVDSKPYFDSLQDRYEEECRAESEILDTKIAQKVEQGLGRSVRGEKDYSVIVILGGDLVKFVKSKDTYKNFSTQTRKQIEIGLQVASFAQEEMEDGQSAIKILLKLMNQSLARDKGWKDFYTEEMEEIETATPPVKLYDVLRAEFEAEVQFSKGKLEKACELMEKLADRFNAQPLEKGWYLQQLARYKYHMSKLESNEIQKAAFTLNPQLLKPKSGITYKRLEFINDNRLARVKNWISKFESYEELLLTVDNLLETISFGVNSEKFEAAFKELGEALGFASQRPDKEIKKGPDILWCGVNNQYFLIECKNEVDTTRAEISKSEAGQMNSHCGWFEEVYGSVSCKRIIIIPTKKLSYHANFTHAVEVMRQGSLKKLKSNVKRFFMEFSKYDINDISDSKLQSFVDAHNLNLDSLKTIYSESYIKAAS